MVLHLKYIKFLNCTHFTTLIKKYIQIYNNLAYIYQILQSILYLFRRNFKKYKGNNVENDRNT